MDPRIQRFRDEEKEKKLAYKRAKQEAARQKAEQEEKVRIYLTKAFIRKQLFLW